MLIYPTQKSVQSDNQAIASNQSGETEI